MEGTSAPVCEEPDATSSGNGDVANAKSVRGRGRGTTRGHSKRAGKTTGDGRGRGGKDIVAEDGPMLKWVTPSPAKASSKAHPTNKKDEEGDLDLTFRTSIVGWMEIDQNRFSVYGHTKKTPVGTKVGTKEQGWVNASDHINSTTGLKLTGDSTRKRMARYREKYISVSKWANSTGAGVPEGSSAQNLDEYLEELCPHYGRMNALFWNSPHKEPHGELSIEAGGLCTFSSRKTKYTMGILSVDDNEGGRAVSANVDESIWEEGHEDQVDQLYGEGGLGSKQGFESERGRLHNNNPYYYNGQDGQARGSQATVTFSGAAFTEFRRPPLERSESGLSASKSTSSSKRSHSGDRSESSQGGAKSSFANPRQEPVINMHSHQPSQEEQVPMEVLQSYKERTESNVRMQQLQMEHEQLLEQYRMRIEQDKLSLEREKMMVERDKMNAEKEIKVMDQRRQFLQSLIADGIQLAQIKEFMEVLGSGKPSSDGPTTAITPAVPPTATTASVETPTAITAFADAPTATTASAYATTASAYATTASADATTASADATTASADVTTASADAPITATVSIDTPTAIAVTTII